jgi:hypothetical protein
MTESLKKEDQGKEATTEEMEKLVKKQTKPRRTWRKKKEPSSASSSPDPAKDHLREPQRRTPARGRNALS